MFERLQQENLLGYMGIIHNLVYGLWTNCDQVAGIKNCLPAKRWQAG
jgi:hypothetical protein